MISHCVCIVLEDDMFKGRRRVWRRDATMRNKRDVRMHELAVNESACDDGMHGKAVKFGGRLWLVRVRRNRNNGDPQREERLRGADAVGATDGRTRVSTFVGGPGGASFGRKAPPQGRMIGRHMRQRATMNPPNFVMVI